MRKHLVDDWKESWKWVSVQAMGLSIALQSVWLAIPDEIKNSTNKKIVNIITIAILVLGAIGRLVKQPTKRRKNVTKTKTV